MLILASYASLLVQLEHKKGRNAVKGKSVADLELPRKVKAVKKMEYRRTEWSPPPAGWVAMSVDGSVGICDVGAGTGAVFRDSEGHYIASCCKFIPTCTDAFEAELLQVREEIHAEHILLCQFRSK